MEIARQNSEAAGIRILPNLLFSPPTFLTSCDSSRTPLSLRSPCPLNLLQDLLSCLVAVMAFVCRLLQS